VSAVVNDNKLETQMSLAVAGTLISQHPKAAWYLGPLPGTTPIHTIQQHLTALRISAHVAISVVNQHLNLGVVQKFRNVWSHGNGAILVQTEMTVLLVLLLLQSSPAARTWNTASPLDMFRSMKSLLHVRVFEEVSSGNISRG
jgi:hypothetical protein